MNLKQLLVYYLEAIEDIPASTDGLEFELNNIRFCFLYEFLQSLSQHFGESAEEIEFFQSSVSRSPRSDQELRHALLKIKRHCDSGDTEGASHLLRSLLGE